MDDQAGLLLLPHYLPPLALVRTGFERDTSLTRFASILPYIVQ